MKHNPFILLLLCGCASPDNNSKEVFESNSQKIESIKPLRVKAMTESISEEDRIFAEIIINLP